MISRQGVALAFARSMTLLGRVLRTRPSTVDRWAIGVLVALPLLINLPFAFVGHPLMAGDNLTQNFPLRVLSGELLRHGRLPLWNPDIWSGAPLLAGWNAAAMYPGTWLFAALPAVAAYEVNVIAVGVIGGLGLYVFVRRQGCSAVASLLAALTFSYTGFMSGQSVHLGLVTGMAFAPWMLVALDQMAAGRSLPQLCRPVALLGVCGGLVILAGDPRAITNDALVVVVYLLAQGWRRRRSSGNWDWRLLAAAGASGLLAITLSAVQWLPGLAFLGQSQRVSGGLSYFGLYSLGGGQLGYLFSPFVFGGNGSLGLPTTNFNLPEFTYSVGLLPLVALFSLGVGAARRRWRGGGEAQPVGVFLAMSVLGIVLALGTKTPLGHLLVHVPLYGGERLQNRNMGIVDLALSVILAFFVDKVSGLEPSAVEGHQRLTPGERFAGAIPPLLVVSLIAAMLTATASTEHLLGAKTLALGLPVRMGPYYGFELVVALVSLVVVLRERWNTPQRRRQLASAVVAADVVMFIAMASYQPAPSGALAEQSPAVAALVRAAGGVSGRSAIFNPQQRAVSYPPNALDDLGVDDLIVLHHLESVQGYGSAVSAAYEQATGSHEVENLRPLAFATPLFDSLDLRIIATLPELFGTVRASPRDLAVPAGSPEPPLTGRAYLEPGDVVDFGALPPAGPWRVAPGHVTELELPGPLAIDAVALRLRATATVPAAAPTKTRLRLVLLLSSGARQAVTLTMTSGLAVVRVPASLVVAGGGVQAIEVDPLPASASRHARSAAHPLLVAIAVHVVPWSGSVPVESGGTSPSRAWFQLDGLLQGLLPRSDWSYQGRLGAVDLYRNEKAFGQAWLQPATSSKPTASRAPGSLVQPGRAEWQDPVDLVDDPKGALLVRSEAYSPGWSVTIVPAAGESRAKADATAAVSLPVRGVGVLQGVDLPPGRWIVSWHYRSVRAEVGLVAGALGLMALVLLVLGGVPNLLRRRIRGKSRVALPSGLQAGRKQPA